MRISRLVMSAALLLMVFSTGDAAITNNSAMVGRAPVYPTKNIIRNTVSYRDHATRVAAVKDAGLVKAFTVLAPLDEAIGMSPTGAVPTLLEPKNEARRPLSGQSIERYDPGHR